MKDTTMPSTTWKADLTTVTDTQTIREIRQWLKRNGQPTPSRDDDALAKYLYLAVAANNRWGGVPLTLVVKRPQQVRPSSPEGYEGKLARYARWPAQPDSPLKQLAQGAFGLLVLLAVVWALGV